MNFKNTKTLLKTLIFLPALLLLSCKSDDVKTINADGELNWLSISDIEKIDNPQGKKFLVDMYTDWCGWCKVMDKKTFTNPEVKKFLDENFYVVKFDAETKTPITFKGKEYNWVARGRKGTNELAIEMMKGRMSYPTMVYLDKDLNVISAIPGYKKPEQLINELKAL